MHVVGEFTSEAMTALDAVAWSTAWADPAYSEPDPNRRLCVVECWDDEDAKSRIEKVIAPFDLRIMAVGAWGSATGGFAAQREGSERWRIGFRGELTVKAKHAIAGLGSWPAPWKQLRPHPPPEVRHFHCYALNMRDAAEKASRALESCEARVTSVELRFESDAFDPDGDRPYWDRDYEY